MEKLKKYIEEITENSGFINIDQQDIDSFLKDLSIVDALKVSGEIESIEDILIDALKQLYERNEESKCIKVLFSVKTSEVNSITMEHIGKISEVLSQFDEDVSVIWGISTKEELRQEELELIILAGFKTK